MNNLCIVQARMSSTRFPGKVLAQLSGVPLIDILIDRLSISKELDHIVIATSTEKSDDILVDYLHDQDVFRGSLLDVRSRYIEITKLYKPKNIIRITADCPLICPEIIDDLISIHLDTQSDYTANCNIKPFPKGFDVEIFKSKIMHDSRYLTENLFEKEHVTPWMYQSGNLKISNLEFDQDLKVNRFNFSVDDKNDLKFLSALSVQAPIIELTFKDILQILNFESHFLLN